MTGAEIALLVIVVALVAVIVRGIKVWPRPKPVVKTFGLNEAEKFLKKRPKTTAEDVALVLDWSVDILGYQNVIGRDIAAVVSDLETKIKTDQIDISGKDNQIAELQRAINSLKGTISNRQTRITEVKAVKQLFTT